MAAILFAAGAAAHPPEADKEARDVLAQGAAEKNPDSRREVAIALSLIATRDPSASLLDKLATDSDHLVREAAVSSVGELGDVARAKVARAALNDDVPEVVFAAARALWRLKQPDGKQALLSIWEKETKAESGFLQGKLRDVARRMKTPKSALLFTARYGLGFAPVPGLGAGFSAVSSVLADADFSARATALLVLATSDRSTEVQDAVKQSLTDEDWSVRAAAVQAMALSRRVNWRSELIPLLHDTNQKVRFRAAATYLRLSYMSKHRTGRSKS